MMNVNDIQKALGDAMFGGDYALAGMVIFAVVMLVIWAALGRKSPIIPAVMMLPIAVIFSAMKILPDSMAIMVALVSILIIAAKGREALA